jgi:hypothetical protein
MITGTIPLYLTSRWCDLDWSPWVPFIGGDFSQLPGGPGLYRVKPLRGKQLVYIGQTGRNLRQRLRALSIYTLANKMPFNDPHTAAPRLWSWRKETGMEFTCSAAACPLPDRNRIGLEHYLIWQYRIEKGVSPVCNFGRCHPGYFMPSNRKLGRCGGRQNASQTVKNGKLPTNALEMKGEPHDSNYMGLQWEPLSVAANLSLPGLYRIVAKGHKEIVYIGQSADLKTRMNVHVSKYCVRDECRIDIVKQPKHIDKATLLELENDLIGAFVHKFGRLPKYQLLAKPKNVN